MTKSSAVPEILYKAKAEAAELIGVSPRTLEDWRLRGAALFAGDNLAHRKRGCSWGLKPPISSRLRAM